VLHFRFIKRNKEKAIEMKMKSNVHPLEVAAS
jgi:hypothetical protein